MRAAFSILGLVIVLAIVLLSAKKQMQAVAPSSGTGASAPIVNRATPAAVKAEVQSAMDMAASAASANEP
ncbi:MAG: hypothetical protein JO006_13285 [Paucibacter sp.]|nr:hypothetical protein [Roseateles sp.]